MLKLIAAPALALAFMASPVLAQSQPQGPSITVTAPEQMDDDQARQWNRLERQADRLIERIADAEVRITDEQSEVARAQARVADAQAKLREEQRELERANNRLAEHREELASTEGRMVAMGGSRPAVALNTP